MPRIYLFLVFVVRVFCLLLIFVETLIVQQKLCQLAFTDMLFVLMDYISFSCALQLSISRLSLVQDLLSIFNVLKFLLIKSKFKGLSLLQNMYSRIDIISFHYTQQP